jgi:hypothetical protein
MAHELTWRDLGGFYDNSEFLLSALKKIYGFPEYICALAYPGGGLGGSTSPPKFRSFEEGGLNSQFC